MASTQCALSFEDFFLKLSRKLEKSGAIQEASKAFAKLRSDKDRFKFVSDMPHVTNMINSCFGDISSVKSIESCLKFKTTGNKYFQAGQFQQALDMYTESIMHAPVNEQGISKELAIGFANRSAALFRMQLHVECLNDITQSLQSGYPQELSYKLHDRKGRCLMKLGRTKQALESFERAIELVADAQMDNKKKDALREGMKKGIEECKNFDLSALKDLRIENGLSSTNIAPALAKVHSTFTSLSDACDVEYTTTQGRFIIAKRDIKPGEIILVEKPYASVVLLDHRKSHCHHCFRRCLAPVPSLLSTYVVFCSKQCREVANEYHQYEAQYIHLVEKSDVGKFGYLALRTVIKRGPKYLREYWAELQADGFTTDNKVLEGCSKDGLYEADNINAIYHLVTHADYRKVHDLFKRTVMATLLLKCLKLSKFFDSTRHDTDFEIFVGGLLLSHIQAFPCNAHEISELLINRQDVAMSTPTEIGAGIYSTLSLFNHSCDPVANRNFYGDICVVRTIKPVHKGEEISDNYGAVYAVHTRAERWEKLKPQYYFQCACQPCVENWPLYGEIRSSNPVWKCSSCQKQLTGKCAVNNSKLISCKLCGREENVKLKEDALQTSLKNYQSAFNDLMQCKTEKALAVFLLHLELMDNLLVKPWRDINNCQEAIKQCYSMMGNHLYCSE